MTEISRKMASSQRIAAKDIKQKDLLTQEQIASIPDTLVYEWIRTGNWNLKDFKTWLEMKESK